MAPNDAGSDELPVPLSLPEQLLLVALDPARGRVGGSPNVYVAMAGGLVQELVDAGAAGIDDGRLSARDGDGTRGALPAELHGAAIAAMAGQPPNTLKHWVGRFAAPKFDLGRQVTEALERRGVLRTERHLRLHLFPVYRLALLDPSVREAVLEQARAASAETGPPSRPRVQALLVLVDAAGLLDRVVGPAERAAAHERISSVADRFAGSEPVHQVTAQVQAEIQAAVIAATTAATTAATIST